MANSSVRLEFAVQMTCESCEKAVQKSLESYPGVNLVSLDRSKERVVVDSAGIAASNIIDQLESSGRRAVLVGSGSTASGMKDADYGAGVAIIGKDKIKVGGTGRPGVVGMARFFQPTEDECLVEGTVDGLQPGEHLVCVHEFGDISHTDCSSCGDIFRGFTPSETVEPAVKRSRQSKNRQLVLQLQTVLSCEDECVHHHLIPMKVCELTERRMLSNLMRQLTVISPLPMLKHLKRVDSTRGTAAVRVLLEERGTSHTSDLGYDFTEVWVPAVPPRTRAQLFRANQHWPCTFHADLKLEAAFNNIVVPKTEYPHHLTHLLDAVRLSELSDSCGAVAADSNGRAVAACHSTDRPFGHAAMVLLDLVARSQGGGAWWPASQPLPRDAFRCTAAAAANPDAYLCTNYDVYLSDEPCTMCAMALLHSRVRRVFYLATSSNGALGSIFRLHCHPRLNHNFEVYKCNFKFR